MFYLFPMNMILFMSRFITKTVKSYVRIFGSVLYNCVSYDAVGENVFNLLYSAAKKVFWFNRVKLYNIWIALEDIYI